MPNSKHIISQQCLSVAKYLIYKNEENNKLKSFGKQVTMTSSRLHKLLYFSEIEYMKYSNGIPLFDDEYTAWPFGPIILNIHSYFCSNATNFNLNCRPNDFVIIFDSKIQAIINKTLEYTDSLDTLDLINISKIESGPWFQAYTPHNSNYDKIISKKVMFDFYSNIETKNILTKLSVDR